MYRPFNMTLSCCWTNEVNNNSNTSGDGGLLRNSISTSCATLHMRTTKCDECCLSSNPLFLGFAFLSTD